MPAKEKGKAIEQVSQIALWLAAGKRPVEIIALAEERWDIGARYTKTLIAEARKHTRQAGLRKGGVTAGGALPVDLDAAAAAMAAGQPAFTALGAPPRGDALAQVDWLLQALVMETDAALRDSSIAPLKRLEEFRKSARACSSLLPPERIYDAEQRLKRHAQGLAQRDDSQDLVDASPVETRPGDDDPQGTGGDVGGAIRLTSG